MPVRGSDATTCATRTFNEGSAPGIAVQFPSLLPGFVPIDGGGQMGGNLLNATNLHAHGAGGAQVAGGDAERGGQDGSAQVLGKILARLEQVQEQTAFLADQSHAFGIALQRLEAEQRRLAGISSRHGSALGLLAATPRSEKSGTNVNLGKEFPIGGTTCDGYSPYAASPSERGGDDGTSSERSCASGRSAGASDVSGFNSGKFKNLNTSAVNGMCAIDLAPEKFAMWHEKLRSFVELQCVPAAKIMGMTDEEWNVAKNESWAECSNMWLARQIKSVLNDNNGPHTQVFNSRMARDHPGCVDGRRLLELVADYTKVVGHEARSYTENFKQTKFWTDQMTPIQFKVNGEKMINMYDALPAEEKTGPNHKLRMILKNAPRALRRRWSRLSTSSRRPRP